MPSFFALSYAPCEYLPCARWRVFQLQNALTQVAWTVDAARLAGTSVALRFCDGLKLGRKVVQLEVFFSRVARQHSSGSPWRAAGANAALHRPEIPPRADLSEARRIHANTSWLS